MADEIKKYVTNSITLNEKREYWVSLPRSYKLGKNYPIVYVLDAEWRFRKFDRIIKNLEHQGRIPKHILIGIPHIDSDKQRGIDFTFSQSKNDYNGSVIGTEVFNELNTGGGEAFYKYLDEELIEIVRKKYSTRGKNILVGHSFGGYFGAYLLWRNTQFQAFQLYDPSIWYSNGEVIEEIKKNNKQTNQKELKVFISYQVDAEFHTKKVKQLIEVCSKSDNIELGFKEYRDETHNSMYSRSVYDGFNYLYSNK